MGNSNWLVAWNMNFIFPYIGNIIIPTDELIFFRGVETTNQVKMGNSCEFQTFSIVDLHAW